MVLVPVVVVPKCVFKMVDVERDAVIAHLRLISLAQVGEICTTLELTIPESKKNNKRAMVNAVLRYLSSEEVEDAEDEGLEIFQNMLRQLKEMLGDDGLKNEEQNDDSQAVVDPVDIASTSKVSSMSV